MLQVHGTEKETIRDLLGLPPAGAGSHHAVYVEETSAEVNADAPALLVDGEKLRLEEIMPILTPG